MLTKLREDVDKGEASRVSKQSTEETSKAQLSGFSSSETFDIFREAYELGQFQFSECLITGYSASIIRMKPDLYHRKAKCKQ